jgi:hypothetical protein
MRNQDGTIQRNRQTHWVHKTKPNAQSRWDNPEKPANTLGTQDKTECAIKMGQSRETGKHIGYTRQNRMRNQDGTIQRNRQTHWVHKTQIEDKQNKKHNTEN